MKRFVQRFAFAGVLAGLSMLAATGPVQAQAPLYDGKAVTLVTSMGPGGTNDLIARMIARQMPRFIPGHPSMMVQNMPGAGNVLATNYMFNLAPKDGTKIAVINNAIPLNQMLDGKGVRYDASKFDWLGSPVTGGTTIIILASAGIRTMEDLLTKEVVIGGIGAGSSNVIWPTAMNNVLGTKFKVVAGYPTGPDLWLAMDRGETQARTGSYSDLAAQRPQWLKERKVIFAAQLGATRDKELPGVPMISGLAKSEEQKQILQFIFSPIGLGQPYLAPPGTAAEPLAVLRQAFQATLRDPAFLADAKKMDFDIDPVSAEDITRIVNETVHAPPAIVAKARDAMKVPGAPE